MKYRAIRKTNLKVSEVGLSLQGVSSGLWQKLTEGEAIRLMHRALDLGIDLFETADTYGFGYSEELMAKAFRKQRDQLVITTKVGYELGDTISKKPQESAQDFSPASIRSATEQALKRLKTDRIDLLQLHNITYEQVHDESVWETLSSLRQDGKILHYGASVGPSLGWLYESVDCIQLRNPAVFQHYYNILDHYPGSSIQAAAYAKLPTRDSSIDDLPEFKHGRMEIEPQIDTCFFARGTHSSEMLEGKYTEKTVFPPEDPRSQRSRSWLLNGLEKIRMLKFLTGKETGRTLGQAALLWLLAEKTVNSCLPTIYSEEQLIEFAQAPGLNPLTIGELMQVENLQARNFGIDEPARAYSGTMEREASEQ